MNTVTKVMRYEIINIENENKKTMKKILKDLQYESRKLGNDIVKSMYEQDNFNKSVVLKQPSYTQKTLRGQLSYEYKKIYTKMNKAGTDTVIAKVMNEYSKNKKDFKIGKSKILSFNKSNSPLYIRDKQMKLIKDKNKHSVNIRLLSESYAEELENGLTITIGKGKSKKEITYKKNTKGMNVVFNIIAKSSYQKQIFEKLMSGEYKIGTSQILYVERKKKWFLNLTYTFTTEEKALDPNKIMGIDVGVNIPAYLAISDNQYYKQPVGSKEEVESFRKQINSRMRTLQKQRKWCGKGSVGHGTKTRLKPLEKLSGKIARFKDTKNHCWSRYIVDEAIKNNCGTIQMEDLTGISEENTFLKTWSYYDLQQKIKYKAEEAGIKINFIDPYMTSKRCNHCGYISKENRNVEKNGQDKFKCINCGHEANADWNAAKNIAMKDIEIIIKEQEEFQNE